MTCMQALPISATGSSSDNERRLAGELETVKGRLKEAVQANVDLHRLVGAAVRTIGFLFCAAVSKVRVC